jgi:hypothetical protein
VPDALILIDVDGVLNPWSKHGPNWREYRAVADGLVCSGPGGVAEADQAERGGAR